MFDLARRNTFFNDTEYRSRNGPGIHGGLRLFERCSDLREK